MQTFLYLMNTTFAAMQMQGKLYFRLKGSHKNDYKKYTARLSVSQSEMSSQTEARSHWTGLT